MLAKTLVFGYKLHVTITTNARAFGKQVSSFVTFIVLLNGFHSSAFIYLPVSVCLFVLVADCAITQCEKNFQFCLWNFRYLPCWGFVKIV